MPQRTPPHDPDAVPRRPRRPRDRPGRAYGTEHFPVGPTTRPASLPDSGAAGSRTKDSAISSRSTDEEARDLVALRRAKRGDNESFAELLRDNDEAVRGFVSSLVGSDAMDAVTRDSYVKAYRGLPLAPSTAPRIWLLGIADGACRDALRRRNRPGSRVAGIESPPVPLAFSDADRLVVALVDGAGLTIREASRLSDLDVNTIGERLTAARVAMGAAPLQQPPPEHGDAFWNHLGHALLIERVTPAMPREAEEVANLSDPEVERHRRPRPSAQTGRAARGMARRVEERTPRQIPWRPIGIAGAVFSVLLVVVIVTLSVAQHAGHRDAGLGVTTQKVLAQLDQALSRDASISGTATVTRSSDPILQTGTYNFVRTAAGSYWVQQADKRWTEAFDQSTSRFTIVRTAKNRTTALVATGVAPGPPSPTAAASESIGDLLSDSVRLVHDSTGASVVSTVATASATTRRGAGPTTTVPGTPVWVFNARFPSVALQNSAAGQLPGVGRLTSISANAVRLVANQSFGLPERVELLRAGTVVFDMRFTNLSIGQSVTTSDFVVSVPEDADVTRTSSNFSVVGIGEAQTAPGQQFRTPSYLPDGFVFATAAADRARRVVVLGYRGGSQQITLTSQLIGAADSPAADPFGRRAAGSSAKAITISSGAFSGDHAWYAELPVPHLWVANGRTVTTLIGDGNASIFTKIASSMQ